MAIYLNMQNLQNLMGDAFSVSAWVVDLMNDICRHKQLKNSMGS